LSKPLPAGCRSPDHNAVSISSALPVQVAKIKGIDHEFLKVRCELKSYLITLDNSGLDHLNFRARHWPKKVTKKQKSSLSLAILPMKFAIPLQLTAAAVFFGFGALGARSAIINAVSVAGGDIAAAVAKAADGDIVQIPPGDVTWTSALTITKAITLQGAGAGTTFIRRNGDILTLSPAHDVAMRVTGIYFDLGPFYQASDRSAIYTASTISDLRIDHCYFRGGSRTVYLQSKAYGVIDHCTFLNSDSEINPFMAGNDGGNTSWSEPIQPGTTNTMVVEDCQFIRDDGLTSDNNEVLYGQNGARCTFRHNTVTQTATTRPLAAIDAHGYSPSWGRGTRFYEIYNNVFHCNYTYRYFYLRGGTHFVYNNTFIEDNDSSPSVIMLSNEGQNDGAAAATLDVIQDSFFWGNSFNGSSFNPVIEDGGNSVVLNRNYFNRAIQPGDKYYPYVPLIYPHPRVTAEDQPSRPAAPTGLRITGSVNQ
jgi:hypothetical protein